MHEFHLHCCLVLELDCLHNNTSFWLSLSTCEITYYLSILSKWVSPLITLSFNHPKPTKGLDALSISPFLVIDDNLIKAYKKILNIKAFRFNDLWEDPLNMCLWIESTKWPQMSIAHIKTHRRLPLNYYIRGVQVCVTK